MARREARTRRWIRESAWIRRGMLSNRMSTVVWPCTRKFLKLAVMARFVINEFHTATIFQWQSCSFRHYVTGTVCQRSRRRGGKWETTRNAARAVELSRLTIRCILPDAEIRERALNVSLPAGLVQRMPGLNVRDIDTTYSADFKQYACAYERASDLVGVPWFCLLNKRESLV